ncbi:hypothetical protein LJC52_04530 [Bacteroidales bacterium OttesenSCG-928-A17]|nr:hypothetical protein [Bacteroidales bacterium OttesenSCG-928-A17]
MNEKKYRDIIDALNEQCKNWMEEVGKLRKERDALVNEASRLYKKNDNYYVRIQAMEERLSKICDTNQLNNSEYTEEFQAYSEEYRNQLIQEERYEEVIEYDKKHKKY